MQADLEAKYQVIFHNFLKDLDSVQQTYELQKANPPRARDAPLVAGCIMWARHLLRRIEQPMNRYCSILFSSLLLYSFLLYSILLYSILFCSALFYPVLIIWIWTLSLGSCAQGEIAVILFLTWFAMSEICSGCIAMTVDLKSRWVWMQWTQSNGFCSKTNLKKYMVLIFHQACYLQ